MNMKFSRLVDFLSKYNSSAVAFSGGMDSALLLCAALEAHEGNTIALTVKTAFFTWDEWYIVRDIVEELNVKSEQIDIDVLSDEVITKNPVDRCYFCKKAIFTKIKEVAARYDCEIVIDGSNVDDENDYRPGKKAINELNIISPLAQLRYGKEDIKEMLNAIGRGYYIKPPNACLATRIKTGEVITKEKLEFVEKAEKIIKPYSNGIVRARYDNNFITVQCEDDINEEIIKKRILELGAKEVYFAKYEKSGMTNA